MSTLRQAAQDVLELVEWIKDNLDVVRAGGDMGISPVLTDKLRAALAEPDSDYERGFVDGMNLQTKGSVDKAVNRVAQTTHWEGCEAVHPECKEKNT